MRLSLTQRVMVDVALSSIIILLGSLSLLYVLKNKNLFFSTSLWVENQNEVSPTDSIAVDFSVPVSEKGISINVYPRADFSFHWDKPRRRLLIKPEKNWQIGQAYRVNIDNVENIFFSRRSAEFVFSVEGYPKITGFSPSDGAKSVVVDIEDPIKINFDRDLSDFDVKAEVSPERKLQYNFDEKTKHLDVIFQDGYDKGQKYIVLIYIKHKSEKVDSYKKILSFSFETERPVFGGWSKNLSERIVQAKEFTLPKLAMGKYIDINLSIQILTIFENGKLLDSFLVSSGKRGMDTPKGQYAISNKSPKPWSKAYGLFMPYWMAVVPSGKFGIHELPEWPGGYKEGANHLGIPVSHGCVRLGVGPAKRVYDWVEIGTPVIIY